MKEEKCFTVENLTEMINASRAYREKLLQDPYRPVYHFAIPEDDGRPGDVNGAFFADGVYHIMYLYKNSETNAYHWGHISSMDLLHWRHHPDALTSEEGDAGCFSGGAFVDEDGTAYLSFWKFPSKDYAKDNGGIVLACAKPPYEKWERMYPIAIEGNKEPWGTLDIVKNGVVEHTGCQDPSNIWKHDGWYYMQIGALTVLSEWGCKEDSDPHYQGDWTELYRSRDLKTWEYMDRFYTNTHAGEDWPDETEDDMCPSFLPLYDARENGQKTDKWLQLFIAHNKGCQYYIGTYENERFYPEIHGRMNWSDSKHLGYFAPEALIDDKNRHIIWTWLADNPEKDFEKYGWSGVFSFPRTVWLEDGILKMAPAGELDQLQHHHQMLRPDENGSISVRNGEIFRMKAVFDTSRDTKLGFKVRVSEDDSQFAEIYYDKEKQFLILDTNNAGSEGCKITEKAPLSLVMHELLSLDIFVDKSVIEVYANEKQAMCRRVYPDNPSKAVGVKMIGSTESLLALDAWEMAPTNPY